jgi:hypothetical protein
MQFIVKEVDEKTGTILDQGYEDEYTVSHTIYFSPSYSIGRTDSIAIDHAPFSRKCQILNAHSLRIPN